VRGKKTEPGTVYQVMADWFLTDNCAETAKRLDLPLTTVCDLVKRHRDKKEFMRLREESGADFSKTATRIIGKALARLEREIEKGRNLPINQLSTVIGTLYDKRALANGESTENTKVVIKLGDADEYGG
jgi:hypothetical protein